MKLKVFVDARFSDRNLYAGRCRYLAMANIDLLIDGTDRRTDRRTDISPTHRRLPLETASVKNTIKKQLVIFVLRSSFGCFETCLSSKLC